MEESAQPKPADPSDPELPNGAGDPDEPAQEEEVAVEEVPVRSDPRKGAGTNADDWRPYTMGELLGKTAERSDFADGNGDGSATPERSRPRDPPTQQRREVELPLGRDTRRRSLPQVESALSADGRSSEY